MLILNNKNIDFSKLNLKFTKDKYTEFNPDKKKIIEFSTNIYYENNNQKINIGELQFHHKSRQVIKFRFYKNFYI